MEIIKKINDTTASVPQPDLQVTLGGVLQEIEYIDNQILYLQKKKSEKVTIADQMRDLGIRESIAVETIEQINNEEK